MSDLPDSYLSYPHRRYGMDQDRYDWAAQPARTALKWPGGQSLAVTILVPIEFHMLNPSGKPFKHPGAMQTPYPDLRHFTTRDYGNRVGVFRLLDAFAKAGVTATFPVSAVLLEPLSTLVEAIVDGGHEVAAYGVDTDHIHWGGLDRDEEAKWVAETRERFTATGLSPRTWMSPARQQSFHTPDLIRAAGFGVSLDWEIDAAPVTMRTEAGSLVCLPNLNELDDRKLLIDQRQTEAEWRDQIAEATRMMVADAPRSGVGSMAFTMTPYVSGQPFRMWAVRKILENLVSRKADIWCATAVEVADAYSAAVQ
jgi:allantoinase